MSSISNILIRRGTELISNLEPRDRSTFTLLNASLFIFIIFTGLAFNIALLIVDYICADVVATLAAVEESHPYTYIRLEENTYDREDEDTATDTVTSKPITSSIRSTMQHLRARGGIRSCFRGFLMYLAFTFGGKGTGFLLSMIIPNSINKNVSFILTQFVSSMLLSTWQMAWVHLVIADKSPQTPYRRMLSFKNWPKIAPSVALHNILFCVAILLPMAGANVVMAILSSGLGPKVSISLIYEIPSAVLMLLLSIPVRVVFIRVAASMLPSEYEPIVPFDRAFGGKVKPDTTENGHLGIVDAWKSFERDARVRYFKIIFKAYAIELGICVVGIFVVVGEVALLLFLTSQ